MNKEVLYDTRLYLNEPKMALDFLVRNLGFVIEDDTESQKAGILKVYDRSGNAYEVCLHAIKNANDVADNKIIIDTSDCLQEYRQMALKGMLIIAKPYYAPEGLAFEISDYWNNRYTMLEKRDYNDQ